MHHEGPEVTEEKAFSPPSFPRKAGIQGRMLTPRPLPWIPAFAGMTMGRWSASPWSPCLRG